MPPQGDEATTDEMENRQEQEEQREGDKEQRQQEEQPPIKMGEVTEENPSGIEQVRQDVAQQHGQFRGNGGPGAAGATVAGPITHAATQGGTKPLPTGEGEEGKPAPDTGAGSPIA